MALETLKRCRICGNDSLEDVIDLGVHSLSGVFPKADQPDPSKAPLVLSKCHDDGENHCGLLQLKHSVPGDEMYRSGFYGYRSGLNRTMTQHLGDIVREITGRVNLSEGDVVLDIGSNDATLLKAYPQKDSIKRIGMDPTGLQFKDYYPASALLVPNYFSAEEFLKASEGTKAKVISSIAMFYDLPDPLKFVRDISRSLDSEGIWVSEQSYMPEMLKTNSFDTICHEHLEYYSMKQINWMLEKAGLKVLDVDFNDTNGGSFRFTAAHKNSSHPQSMERLREIESIEGKMKLDTIEPYCQFNDRVEIVKEDLMQFLVDARSRGKTVYILGASTKGNTLLQYFGIGKDIVAAASERNPEKVGRVTPLTRIPIVSEEQARAAKPDYMLVLPWHFRDELIEREQTYLQSGGKLIFPLPNLEVVGARHVKQ